MSQAFIGYRSGVSLEALTEQIQGDETGYYYLQYVDRVEGFLPHLSDKTLSPEGRLFNPKRELRWQQRGEGYDLLWLGCEPPPETFKAMAGDWDYCDRPAKVYLPTEARLPKGVPASTQSLKIGQRYFCDCNTAIVHFVALTVN